jgi:hypothetical protein
MKNLWGVLVSFARRIVIQHILYPLLFGVVADVLSMRYITRTAPTWKEVPSHLFAVDHVAFIVGIVATYICIMYLQVKRETGLTYNVKNLLTVKEKLDGAKSYFALSPISMRQWFNPPALSYFSLLLSEQHPAPGAQNEPALGRRFDYVRTAVFSSNRKYSLATTPYLDRDFSFAFAWVHDDFGIPLAFVTTEELCALLDVMEPLERRELISLPRFLRRIRWRWIEEDLRPPFLPRLIPNLRAKWAQSFLLSHLNLDFALIDYGDRKVVLRAPTGKENVSVIGDHELKSTRSCRGKYKNWF